MGRIKSLDFVRVISMFAVILLHTSGAYIFAESGFAPAGINLAFLLNQSARFAVPMFILLSGLSYGLFQASESPGIFFKKRLTKILIPYILWSLVYCVYNNGNGLIIPNPAAYIKGLAYGSLSVHLYFVVVIIQLYLLAFPLKRLMDKHSVAALTAAFTVTFAFQTVIYLTCFGVEIVHGWFRLYMWELFPTWLFYFAAGMAVSRGGLEKLTAFAGKYFYGMLVMMLFIIPLFALDSRATNSYALSIKPLIMTYTALVFVFICGFAERVKRYKLLDLAVKKLSAISYTVYLSHVLFLMMLRKITGLFNGTSGMLLLFAAVCVTSIAFSLLLDLLFKQLRRLIRTGVRNTTVSAGKAQ